MDLDERKMKILKAIIATYLETGEPVGSRTIAKDSDLNLSSATIRNEMADLEELGYILQPHTSAGRIPSDLGYRYYVDRLMEEKESEFRSRENEMREERDQLLQKMDRMEEAMKKIADLLAASTNYATLITTPQNKSAKLKFIQLSMIDSSRLLVVVVLGNDTVKNMLMNMEEPLTNEEVLKLNILLNSFLQGLTLNEITLELVHTMKAQAGMHASVLEDILNGIVEAIHEADDMQIFTSGATNMLKYPELVSPGHTSALLDTLVEKGNALVQLVDDTVNQEERHGIQVYIGNETPVQSLKNCSIVTATYELKDGGTGTVGIIGPKRMDYHKVVDTLKNLTEDLDDIFNNKT
ncbi:MAG: heat-inducible transcriptional repressor HrcA [Clostridiales bacterium]|nr:heat-inducible transcriptional repressor HrcA [Clostridiales bacterium]